MIGQTQHAGTIAPPSASEAAGWGPVGLVSNETKGPRIEIDRHAKRCKRMRTAVHHSARLIDFDATAGSSRVNRKLVTLTYRKPDDWNAGDIGAFRRVMRNWFARRGITMRAVWVAELQQRGALHYHVLVWVPRGVYFPKPDNCGWWPHGSTNVKTVSNGVAYIAKYASKTESSAAAKYPKGARMHGAIGLGAENKRHLRYWQAPIWVRDELHGTADIRKIKGGYVDRFTGAFAESPWTIVFEGGRIFAQMKPAALAA